MNRLMLQRVLTVSLIFFSIILISQDVKKDTVYYKAQNESKVMKKNLVKLDSLLSKIDTVKIKHKAL